MASNYKRVGVLAHPLRPQSAPVAEQIAAFLRAQGIESWVGSFIASRDLKVETIVSRLKEHIDGIEGKLDYVAAFLDMTTNYYEHTGTQSIARSLISRAAGEI